MPFCTYCGTSFTRDEHLERHILTHTNVKPWRCPHCHMSFGRRDLLQRHYTVHGKDPDQQPAEHHSVLKSGGRTPIACTNCAKTKTKCDKKYPCSRCADRGLVCEARPTRRATKTQAARQRMDSGPRPAADTIVKLRSPGARSNASSKSPQVQPSPSSRSSDLARSSIDQDESRKTQSRSSPFDQTPAHIRHTSSGSPSGSSVMQATPESGFDFDDFLAMDAQLPCIDQSIDQQDIGLDWGDFGAPLSLDGLNYPDFTFSPMHTGLHGLDGPLDVESQGCYQPLAPDFNPRTLPAHDEKANAKVGSLASKQILGPQDDRAHGPRAKAASPGVQTVSDGDADAEAWPVFQCNPCVLAEPCTRTTEASLRSLDQGLRTHQIWLNWSVASSSSTRHISVAPLQEMSRDILHSTTLRLLSDACSAPASRDVVAKSSNPKDSSSSLNKIPLLPPNKVLEHFLSSYYHSFGDYFPLNPTGTLDINAALMQGSDHSSSHHALLMIAKGADASGDAAQSWLTPGIVECCRLAVNDIKSDLQRANDMKGLQSGLLLVNLMAWSGDKWQMEDALERADTYITLLKRSTVCNAFDNSPVMANAWPHPESVWRRWQQQEERSRLFYSWVMMDQESALMHDRMPSFSLAEITAALPDADELHAAQNATEWSQLLAQGSNTIGMPQQHWSKRPISLRELFYSFVDNALHERGVAITALHLRLLLQPLQALIHQHRANHAQPGDRRSTAAGAAQLQEAQGLLQRWYGLADLYMRTQGAPCRMMQTSLMMFHLISLNMVTDFGGIEELARGRRGSKGFRPIADLEEALFHAGQVLRLAKAMASASQQPCWWAGSIYRAGLVLWCDATMHGDGQGQVVQQGRGQFALDGLTPDQPQIVRYLVKREGCPMLSRADGGLVALDDELEVLRYCVDTLGLGVQSRLSHGVSRKLLQLGSRRA